MASATLDRVSRALVGVMPYHEVAPSQNLVATAGTTLVGIILGAVLWKEHRVLGGLTGFSFGLGVGDLISKNYSGAVRSLCSGAGALGLSLAWHKHPVWGNVLGGIGGGVAGAIASKALHLSYLSKGE